MEACCVHRSGTTTNKGQVVHLDGYSFTNCCFHNCTLVTDTGVFSLNSCTISGCTVRYGANAARIIQREKIFIASTLKPRVALDGAITIE